MGKEKYKYEYSNNAKGTIADKQSFAQEQVKEETLVNIIFDWVRAAHS